MFKSQEMHDKAVDTWPFVFDSVPDQYITQEMCDKIVSKEFFMLKYCLDIYKAQEKAVDSYLLALNFVSDWVVTNKIIEKLDNAVFSIDDIIFGEIESDIVTFFIHDIG